MTKVVKGCVFIYAKQVNYILERLMPFIAPLSVVVGVLMAEDLKRFSVLVPWIFAFMTFSGSLNSSFKALKKAVMHPLPIIIALFSLHIIMPVWAFSVGHIAFSNDMLTITGLILAMVIPTGITSFIWVAMYRGNIALTLSIILIDTLLSPLIVPYSLSILVGESVNLEVWNMMLGLMGMIVIPSVIGMALNEWTKGKAMERLGPKLSPLSKIALATVIMINTSVVAPYLRDVNQKLILVGLIVLFIAFCGYLFAWLLGILMKCGRDTIIALTFTGGMRNISAGAVIAVAYFPPAVAVPVVIGMLFQQVLASVYGQLLQRYFLKHAYNHS